MRAFIVCVLYLNIVVLFCYLLKKTLVAKLDSVQRRFTKRLPGLHFVTYDERCACRKIDRLELRLYADNSML